MGKIRKEGELVKSPPESKMEKGSSWKKRYFVLAEISRKYDRSLSKKEELQDASDEKGSTFGIYLMYWKNHQDRNKGKKPLGIIDISSGCKVSTNDFDTFPHTMENLVILSTPKRTFILSASSKELMNEWFDCLNESIYCDRIPVYDRIYDTILDFVYLLNDNDDNDKDGDSTSCSSSGTQSSGSFGERSKSATDMWLNEKTTTPSDGETTYVHMSSSNGYRRQNMRSHSVNDTIMMNAAQNHSQNHSPLHYEAPKRRCSSKSVDSFYGAQYSSEGQMKEICFHDIKLIVPSKSKFEFIGNVLEVRTDYSVCRIEENVNGKEEDTKL